MTQEVIFVQTTGTSARIVFLKWIQRGRGSSRREKNLMLKVMQNTRSRLAKIGTTGTQQATLWILQSKTPWSSKVGNGSDFVIVPTATTAHGLRCQKATLIRLTMRRSSTERVIGPIDFIKIRAVVFVRSGIGYRSAGLWVGLNKCILSGDLILTGWWFSL